MLPDEGARARVDCASQSNSAHEHTGGRERWEAGHRSEANAVRYPRGPYLNSC